MDFSNNNLVLWNPVIQLGIIAVFVLIANILRRKIKFIRNSLMPTAVIAGFLLLILRSCNILNIDGNLLEIITYHALALGFIAMSLRVPEKNNGGNGGVLHGAKSGALIVSTYLIQALIGLTISILLVFTFMPELFPAAGILLPMAFGQGPGQANNVGTTYESLGMIGGRSFGLSLAAVGYLVACSFGVVYLNILHRKKKLNKVLEKDEVSGSVTVDMFQDKNEIPISQSIDKLSIQIALVVVVYLLTYLVTWGVSALIGLVMPGMANTLSTLLWGFNFIIGSALAMGVRSLLGKLKKHNIMKHQYQNNYLLNRVSGLAFDLMIIAGIASINISDLSGMWVPFIIMAVLGGVGTFYYLKWICKKVCPNYFYESFFSMFGMLTGTLSSGVLLLREIDPDMKTNASNDLIAGSSFGIIFGIPMLLLVSFAAGGLTSSLVAVVLVAVYLTGLILFMLKVKGKNKRVKQINEDIDNSQNLEIKDDVEVQENINLDNNTNLEDK